MGNVDFARTTYKKNVALNLFQGRTGVYFCDAEMNSARRFARIND